LRPWGNKGPIATRLSTLGDYLEQESWTYERMAMTRARVVTGSPRFSAAIGAVICGALQRCAGRRELRTDVLEMRALIHAAKETANPWDIKHVRGGLIDIEFIAQYLMLRHAGEQPALVHAATAEALRRLCSAGILGLRDFEILSGALSSFKHVMQATRVACLDGPLPDSMSNAFAGYLPATMGESGLTAVETRLRSLQACVQDAFGRLTGS
jgi:glutamate-ammonia-ligase adenylyltransferase